MILTMATETTVVTESLDRAMYSKSCCLRDAIVQQVFDELGLSLSDKLSDLPSTGGALQSSAKATPQAAAAAADDDSDLQARLDNLRRE
jgi:division protein CdvB (Snf7/Vps24/ESCRT-III family)